MGRLIKAAMSFQLPLRALIRLILDKQELPQIHVFSQYRDIQIRVRDFTVSTIITQPLCNGDLGNIQLAANDVEPQYFFSIYQGATLVNSVGPITENNYTFGNLNPGTYTVNVGTEDGCTFTDDVEIIEPPLLTATSALTIPLTCNDGEITVYPVGGTAPYFYFVNSTTDFQTVPRNSSYSSRCL
ncbi:hypothetical protein N7U66_00010 [Lacinutrix neustonica]|uniref:Uncharacterized protein n=1 Tax=Lacinutrix neustonica TaxID=2980107 RepID=A0A9E8SDY0_9FLAO|nr:hypothetical protein [Lacinutrix neustonica]WAC02222.1 hypothetical protein N7U66_00010 [Lacinutrix neustonica]